MPKTETLDELVAKIVAALEKIPAALAEEYRRPQVGSCGAEDDDALGSRRAPKGV